MAERDLDAHVRATRAEGLPDYVVAPAGQRDERFPILYVHPESPGSLRMLGYDMNSNPVRRAAMEPARDSGEQIHQVIMNLGTNAWQAMTDEAGTIEVTLGRFDVDVDFARTRAELKPGPHALLSIRDTGCGMDHATQRRILDPFFTTKEPGKGTGLASSSSTTRSSWSAGAIRC